MSISESAPRRTFAIISHPDAGKTTLTEKLLLYSGAIEEAGAVKARAGRQRDATSDWMEMERQRGISITSTVLQFEHRNHVFNLLDTPGHRDFSEDTYRVVSAVDAAIIVLDAAKGIEPQTLKLFQVAKARGIPLITYVNKCDRPGLAPLEILDDIESQLGMRPTPVTWPVGFGPDFEGVVDRRDSSFWRFDRSAHGATAAAEQKLEVADLAERGTAGETAAHEVELLDAVGSNHNRESFMAGETTPVFFGSAIWNFGIRLLLDALVDLAPAPGPQKSAQGLERPLDAPFSGFVFKIQANLDPRHRDRVAYIRVCSGRFERGMSAMNERSGRPLGTKYAHQVFGRERDTVEFAYPGDIVALVNTGDVRIGDSLSIDGDIRFPTIPTFAPEYFMEARNLDTSKFKQFRRGMEQLDQEGVIQVLRSAERGDQQPLLAAVGPLQYDVATYRLESEYGAKVLLSPTQYTVARRTDQAGAEILSRLRDCDIVSKTDGTLLALFFNQFRLDAAIKAHPDLVLESVVNG